MTGMKHLPLARLCEEHRAFADKTPLADNLGDGVLYARNQVFRRIRDSALALGCRYSTDDPGGYFAWPLTQLTSLLASRQIPYRKTYAAVSSLAAADGRFFTTAHAESLELQPNVVMHESAHCIADGLWRKHSGTGAEKKSDVSQLLRFSLAESFANTTELAAMAFCERSEDRWLLTFNSYWSWQDEIASAWRLLARELEPAAPARWVLACFLSANLQKKKPMRELSALHGITPQKFGNSIQAALKLLQDEAFLLNPVFRRETFEMFFRSIGCDPKALLATPLDESVFQQGVFPLVWPDLLDILRT